MTAPGSTENGSVLLCVVTNTDGHLVADGALYVRSYDPEAYDGRGDVSTTVDPTKAARWPSNIEAIKAWRTIPSSRPLRDDGKPNRPLAALTVETIPVDDVVPDAATCRGCDGIHLDDLRECAHGSFGYACYVGYHDGQDFCPSVDER